MGDPLGSFPQERVSEDKACWKDSYWFVGTVGQIWDVTCTVENGLKDLIGITYINKMHILFGSRILGTPKLSVLDLE